MPAAADLKPIVAALATPGWRIDPATRRVTRLSEGGTLNVDSLGKGYIVTKAAVAARTAVPGVSGLLVNTGGDIFASGRPTATGIREIGAADPKHSEDNAPPLVKVHLADQAISTSAAYERGYTIGGKRYSHILWLSVPKWRPLGLTAAGVCLVVCAGVYFTLVPQVWPQVLDWRPSRRIPTTNRRR